MQGEKIEFGRDLEPKMSSHANYMHRGFGFSQLISYCNSKIWVISDEFTHMEVVIDNKQFLHFKGTHDQVEHLTFCSVVYAKCDRVACREIWDFMHQVAESDVA